MTQKMIMVFAVLASGCYGTVPTRPDALVLPAYDATAAVVVAERVEARLENREKVAETCPSGHASGSPSCVRTTYSENELVEHVIKSATYGGKSIGKGQLIAMSDPEWRSKERQAGELVDSCQRADQIRQPASIATLGGLAAGAIGYPVSAAVGADTTVQWVILGVAGAALAGGAVAYGVGYFGFGGADCEPAAVLVSELAHAKQAEASLSFELNDAAAAAQRVNDGQGLAAAEWPAP